MEQPCRDRRERLEALLRAVVAELVEKYEPEKIIVFGSLATGNIGPLSDLDLAVVKETSKGYYERVLDILEAVHSDDDEPVDYLLYTPAEFEFETRHNPFVREEILRNGKVVYDSSRGTLAL
jgi:predicted nucleotidyltransferase